MKCLVIEDEKIAAERLCSLIKQADHSIEIMEVIQTVEKSVKWFNTNASPDLIFMDIQLADGLSFEIFEQAIISAPVIFTTAFQQQHSRVAYSAQVFESIMHSLTSKYKTKFVIRVGEHIKIFPVEDVQCFYSLEKSTFLQNLQGRDYAISYSLDQLEELLDPSKFFRISRKYIVSFPAIKDIISYSNSRLLLRLENNTSDDLIVSRERVQAFREWLEK